jgi:hypothetical protein
MNAQALTVPITRISVPALLIAAAGTAAAVSLAALVVDERTIVSPPATTVPAVADEPQTPGEAYVEQLVERRRAYLDSLRDD